MSNCEQDYITLAQWITGGVLCASLIQWARQLWNQYAQARLPQVQYAQELPTAMHQPLPVAIGLQNGRRSVRTFYFPRGITYDHLTLFGEVVAQGKKPTSRALKSVFTHADFEAWRDYLMVPNYNRVGVLAEYLSGREDWDVTPLGRQLAIQWRCKTPSPPLLSVSLKVRVCSKQSNLGAINQKPRMIPKGE